MTLPLGEAESQFLADHHRAAMITLRADGTPHVAQVGIGLVQAPDGTQRLWSSGTQGRVRTRHLRRDPRCTLFVFDPPMRWLGLEATVTILDGPDAAQLHPRLFRAVLGLQPEQKIAWGGRQATDEEIVAMTAAEQRLIYDFTIHKAYGRLAV
jgi:PPOX class probable F420-dependent enzyme